MTIGSTIFVSGYRLDLSSYAQLANFLIKKYDPKYYEFIGYGGIFNKNKDPQILVNFLNGDIINYDDLDAHGLNSDNFYDLNVSIWEEYFPQEFGQEYKLYILRHDAEKNYGAYAVIGIKIAEFDFSSRYEKGFHGCILNTKQVNKEKFTDAGLDLKDENFGIIPVGYDCECCL